MRSRAIMTMPAGLLCALVVALLAAQPAPAASITFTPCPDTTAFSCASLPVPLARGGNVPGSIALSVEAQAGGLAAEHERGRGAGGRAGTGRRAAGRIHGRSDRPRTEDPRPARLRPARHRQLQPTRLPGGGKLQRRLDIAPVRTVRARDRPRRAGFTSEESVHDIEALRVAGGYEKLVLYGTSYGTKVALEYAQQYPQHVESLLLDSVVPVDGPEPFAIPSFRALPGVLRELCCNRGCAGITATRSPISPALNARLRHRALSGSVFDGKGRRHPATLDEPGLLRTIEAGDVNPALRALLPAGVRSALNGDPDPLLRLHVLSEGLIPTLPRERQVESTDSVDEALFATTTCEETPFPWSRSAPAATRLGEAHSFLEGQPSSYFYPFDAATAYTSSLLEACAAWPDASPAPPAEGGFPDVPTLILSGGQDLRTPTSNARQVAAEIPDAEVEVVPFTGHSVLGSDLSECASAAVTHFFSGQPIAPCAPSTNPFTPTPLDPTRLSRVRAPHALSGRPGRTLVAALDAILDLSRQVVGATLQADETLPTGSSFGGLRGGYATLASEAVVLHGFSFVPGVDLSGRLSVSGQGVAPAVLRVSGSQASDGDLHLSDDLKRASGTLGGHSFRLSVASVRLSSVGGGEWPTAQEIRGRWWPTP